MKTFYPRATVPKPARSKPSGWRRGQSIIEAAVVTPVLLIILLSIIDFGRVMYFYIGIGEAARAGAQYGAQSLTTAPDTAGMISAANKDAPSGKGLTMHTTTAQEICQCSNGTALKCGPPITTMAGGSIPPTCTDIRIWVKVQTSATLNTLINYHIFPSSFTLNGLSQIRAQ